MRILLNNAYIKPLSQGTFLLLLVSVISCNQLFGDHPLGNNLSLLEGDRMEDRAIVYCTGYDAGICTGGVYIVPSYENMFDSQGNYAEYVQIAESNKDWIIARTLHIKTKKENYWIISKDFKDEDLNGDKRSFDSVIQSHITGPLNLNDFQNKIQELNIDLKFEEK